MNKISLNNNWKLRGEELNFGPEKMPEVTRRQEGWMEISVPCDIHTPLIEYGYISFDGKEKVTENAILELMPHSKKTVFEFQKGKYDFTKGACIVRPAPGRADILPKILRTGVFKDLNIPEAVLKVSNIKTDKRNIIFDVSSNLFAHAVHFNPGEDILFSDDYFDLLPEEKRTIVVYDAADKIKESDIKPVSVNSH